MSSDNYFVPTVFATTKKALSGKSPQSVRACERQGCDRVPDGERGTRTGVSRFPCLRPCARLNGIASVSICAGEHLCVCVCVCERYPRVRA
eukprot:GHVU01190632.1.p1 GENE.GHVU01190632.1~~GHVU01190632.1.p1  ORF type:complete len:101 (+),score=1.18 GHVU01190632.1:32-304(+)